MRRDCSEILSSSSLRPIGISRWSKEPTARLLPRDEARRIYESIVRQVRDPALLEFAGYNLIRSSVFPVEARGTQKVRLTYEHIVEVDGNRVDFVYDIVGCRFPG